MIDQVHAGKITAAQYVAMKLVGQFNDDLACRESGCSRELFDNEYAVGACQVNLEFRGYIEWRRRRNPDRYKRFATYVDGPANCKLK